MFHLSYFLKAMIDMFAGVNFIVFVQLFSSCRNYLILSEVQIIYLRYAFTVICILCTATGPIILTLITYIHINYLFF